MERKITKEIFCAAKKNSIVISKLVKTKTYSRYLIGYLDKVIRPYGWWEAIRKM